MEIKKDPRGRKPVSDKTKSVRIYIKQSEIDKIGGYEKVQDMLYLSVKRKMKSFKNV